MSATRYAVVLNGEIVDVIIWDGIAPFAYPDPYDDIVPEAKTRAKWRKASHPNFDKVAELEARIAALEGKRASVSPAIDIINGASQR